MIVGSAGIVLIICMLILLCAASLSTDGAFLGWAAVCMAVFALLLWISVVWIIKPYRRMEQSTRLFLEGYTTNNLSGIDETYLMPSSRFMEERLQRMLDSSELLKLNKRQAQYLAIQNQINPHFLYNTLESIRSEALIAGLTSVSDMTEALAAFFRYTISKVENLVSVEEELQNCETYFKIQRYRFGERVQLTIECDSEEKEEIYRCRLPKLTMQPILENSIIHGTECKIGVGHLKIRLENFSMTIRAGEILGLVPVNNDGLETLFTLLKHNLPLHYGYIYYREKLVNEWSNPKGGANRISIIRTESSLAKDLTVADNIFVLRPGFRKWFMKPSLLRKQADRFGKYQYVYQ